MLKFDWNIGIDCCKFKNEGINFNLQDSNTGNLLGRSSSVGITPQNIIGNAVVEVITPLTVNLINVAG